MQLPRAWRCQPDLLLATTCWGGNAGVVHGSAMCFSVCFKINMCGGNQYAFYSDLSSVWSTWCIDVSQKRGVSSGVVQCLGFVAKWASSWAVGLADSVYGIGAGVRLLNVPHANPLLMAPGLMWEQQLGSATVAKEIFCRSTASEIENPFIQASRVFKHFLKKKTLTGPRLAWRKMLSRVLELAEASLWLCGPTSHTGTSHHSSPFYSPRKPES